MANNRYFLHCPVCHDTYGIGKSLGEGIYRHDGRDREFGEEMLGFMWDHLLGCQPEGEWAKGSVFDMLTEYGGDMEVKDGKFVHSKFGGET